MGHLARIGKAICLISTATALLLFQSGCTCSRSANESATGGESQHPVSQKPPHKEGDPPDYSGIEIPDVIVKELRPGKGPVINSSSVVTGYYQMWVYDPALPANKGILISEAKSGQHQPMKIDLREDEIVAGWKKGLLGMKAGAIRSIIVPAELGYGSSPYGNVPANSILLIEFEAVSVQ